MAVIHRTTLVPTKLDLLAGWLPTQDWYEGEAEAADLVNAGGFRLDDPDGEVGIEFMVVVDTGAPEPVAYLVPLAYRGAALADAPDAALIGTAEHGVLGTRWVYDGVHDPVVTSRLHALLRGEATPQHQRRSDTPDPTVTVLRRPDGETDRDTDLRVRVNRVLTAQAADAEAAPDPDRDAPARLVATWTWPDGTPATGVFAVATAG